MTQVICAVCLLIAATSTASDDGVTATGESQSFDFERAFDEAIAESGPQASDFSSSLTSPSDEPTDEQDEVSGSAETDSVFDTTDTSGFLDVEEDGPRVDLDTDTSSSIDDVEPITLDELLRQIRETPHLQREALLTRLAERRRLAIALRTTLEAAEHVAKFGEAGAELLQDASLDEVVATMIKAQEQAAHETAQPAVAVASPTHSDTKTSSAASPEEVDAEKVDGFDAWRLVYIVRDARGQKVGWRHLESEERAVTYVGEHWQIGADTIKIESVSSNQSGNYLVIEVNGERRELHLF